jgi:hypothetical protein
MAKKERKSEFVGFGALLQFLGLLAPFLGFLALGILGAGLGLIALPILLVVGSSKAKSWVCGECRGKIDKKANVCQHCRADLSGSS